MNGLVGHDTAQAGTVTAALSRHAVGGEGGTGFVGAGGGAGGGTGVAADVGAGGGAGPGWMGMGRRGTISCLTVGAGAALACVGAMPGWVAVAAGAGGGGGGG